MKILPKYSLGVGDRFAHQTRAQLEACVLALAHGVEVVPVWNKSNREHTIIGSEPFSARTAADFAVKACGWKRPYFCDADHINLETVDRFLEPCDFFTIDVADFIGQAADPSAVESFVTNHRDLVGILSLPDAGEEITVTEEQLVQSATKFLLAVQSAGKIYKKIESAKGRNNFVVEVSMDETDSAQTPVELLIILAAIAEEGIPIQTIAPKFSGRFNKGVDYVGDLNLFAHEFTLDMAVIQYAITSYGLPPNLKLSVHSGSDKFSIYPAIHALIKKFDAGIHVKTAGTTWLEEVIGLAESGGTALAAAREIYAEAYGHKDELCAPYASVIDIRFEQLPAPEAVNTWTSEQFVSALRHDLENPAYNLNFRQLLHISFKIAARMGQRYIDLLEENEETISKNVTENLYERHIKPIFFGEKVK